MSRYVAVIRKKIVSVSATVYVTTTSRRRVGIVAVIGNQVLGHEGMALDACLVDELHCSLCVGN